MQALVRYAAEHEVPLVPRGAGTGVAGESLGAGLVVDLSRHFRQIVEVGSDTIRVQPGVTLQEVNTRLARDGRRFADPPAPAPAPSAACWPPMLPAPAPSNMAIPAIMSPLSVWCSTMATSSPPAAGRRKAPSPSVANGTHWHDIAGTVAVLLEQNAELIQSAAGRIAFNRCGYTLDRVLSENSLDVPRLLIGSEGTLALFTEATLRTVPVPGGQSLLLLGFASLDAALQAVRRALPSKPSACELIDRRLLSLARTSEAANVAMLVPPEAEAVLLIEFEADSPRRLATLPWNWPICSIAPITSPSMPCPHSSRPKSINFGAARGGPAKSLWVAWRHPAGAVCRGRGRAAGQFAPLPPRRPGSAAAT